MSVFDNKDMISLNDLLKIHKILCYYHKHHAMSLKRRDIEDFLSKINIDIFFHSDLYAEQFYQFITNELDICMPHKDIHITIEPRFTKVALIVFLGKTMYIEFIFDPCTDYHYVEQLIKDGTRYIASSNS